MSICYPGSASHNINISRTHIFLTHTSARTRTEKLYTHEKEEHIIYTSLRERINNDAGAHKPTVDIYGV